MEINNHQYLNKLTTTLGYKVTTPPMPKHFSIKFIDAKKIFYNNIKIGDVEKIHKYLHPRKKYISVEGIFNFCEEVLDNTLFYARKGIKEYARKNTTLRGVFIERVLFDGCPYAILFLKKFHYKKIKK